MAKQDDMPDEEGIDPEKLFDAKQYNTVIINREGFSNKENNAADLVESLLDPGNTRQQNEEIFSELKKHKAANMMVQAIRSTNDPAQQKLLIAACWESGLDMKDHYLFFVELACNPNYEVAMEAYTVVTETEMEDAETLKEAMRLISRNEQRGSAILGEVKQHVQEKRKDS